MKQCANAQFPKHTNTDQSGEVMQSGKNQKTSKKSKKQTDNQKSFNMMRTGQIIRKVERLSYYEDTLTLIRWDVCISNPQKLCCYQDMVTSINWTCCINRHFTLWTHRINYQHMAQFAHIIIGADQWYSQTINDTGLPDKHHSYKEATSYSIVRRRM